MPLTPPDFIIYTQCPTRIDLTYKKLDPIVLRAYGWLEDLSDEEMLERLLQ